MPVRTKTLVIISSTIIFLIAVLYSGSRFILEKSSNRQEELRLRENIQRVLNGLSNELSNLNMLTSNYAAWDDTYAFIQNSNKKYIQSNLVDETFINNSISLILFVNARGQIVFDKGFDLSHKKEKPIPESLSKHLAPNSRLLKHANTESCVQGILILPESSYLVVSRPILTSELKGPSQGTLIIGRALDADGIKRLSQIINLPLAFQQVQDAQVPQEVKAAFSSSVQDSIFVKILKEDFIGGFSLVKDIYGRPAFIISIKLPRMFHKQFLKDMRHFFFSTLLIGLISILVIQLLLERMVISRLSRLDRFIKGIEASKNLGERLYISGRDELSKLAGAVNSMLETLERHAEKNKQAEETIKKSEAQHKALYSMVRLMCDIVPDLIWAKDLEKKFIFANKAMCEKLLNAKDTEEPVGKTDCFFIDREKRVHPENSQYHTFGETCIDSDSIVINSQKPERFDEFGNVQGKFLFLDVYKAPFWDEVGNMIGIVGCARDITREKLTEKEQKVAEKKLQKSEVKYHTLFEASTDAIFLARLDGRILDCNNTASELFAYAKEELLKLLVADLITEETKERLPAITQEVTEKGRIFLEVLSKKKSDEIFPADINIRLAKVGEELLAVIYARDISERKRAEKLKNAVYKISEAASSALNLNELFHLIHSIIKELIPTKNFYISLYDAENEILSFPYFIDEYDETPTPKKLGKGLTEYVLSQSEPLLVRPEKFEELEKKGVVESIGAPSIDWLGVPLKTEDKTIGVMVIQSYTKGTRFGEEDKNILMFVSSQVAMAIERKRAEEQLKASLKEKEVLLREVHHRVKNNMQVISSLFNLQAGQLEDKKAVGLFKECQGRIRTMALVHEKLYQSKDLARINFSEYIQSLVIHLFHFWQVNPDLIKLNLDLAEVFLDINSAVPCGLIVNELVSNAIEHAFPKGKNGEIYVKLHPVQDSKFELLVRDNGVGMPKGLDLYKTETLGMQLVTLLVKQLDGSIELSRGGGTNFRIIFSELKYKPRI